MRSLIPLLLCAACDPSSFIHIQPGVPPQPIPPVDADRFADDLRAHLDGWYTTHGTDVDQAGGASLAEAVLAVDAALADRLTDPAEDPFADDLSTTAVYVHPDVVFPGSDRRWFGAYRLSGGENLYIEDFE